jgi:nucleotide-binding universal stress UspA family protein
MDVQNILVAIDYSDDSQQALHWGADLAGKYGATLLVLHVQPTSFAREDHIRQLHDFASRQLKAQVPLRVTVAVGEPAEEILRVAREEWIDLIVMGTHGRTGVRHLLFGSVAEEVTRQAPCPVFTVRMGTATASRA